MFLCINKLLLLLFLGTKGAPEDLCGAKNDGDIPKIDKLQDSQV